MKFGVRILLLSLCVIVFGDHAFATTYYVASSGSDANSGTSKSNAWLHAPGMPDCTAKCAVAQPQPGDRFIFRGGDIWHFGNSSASPYTGGEWVWGWSGTSATYIYIGVDPTWYSGNAWKRPILTADNHTSTVAVSSCSYSVGSATTNTMVTFNDRQYIQFDNFEMTGLCESNSSGGYGSNSYIIDGGPGQNLFTRDFFHGWTHMPYNCSSGGLCFDMQVVTGNSSQTSVFQYDVWDGSDSDPAGITAIFNDLYDVHDSVIRYTANVLGGNCHTFHDNLVEYSYEPGDNVAHGNIYECDSDASASTPSTFYDNVIRDTGAGGVGVGIWPEPPVGTTDYYFNNVMYNIDAGGGNYFNLGQNSSNQGTVVLFNNTMQNPQNSPIVKDSGKTTYAHPLLTANNLFITNASNGVSTAGSWTSTTDLTISNDMATKDGYTSSQTYAYSPTSSNSITVGAGSNIQSTYCSPLSGDSSAYSACTEDTTYACEYVSNDQTVICPLKSHHSRTSADPSIGAYLYAPFPDSPSAVTGTVVLK